MSAVPRALTAVREKIWLNETTNRVADEILDEIWTSRGLVDTSEL